MRPHYLKTDIQGRDFAQNQTPRQQAGLPALRVLTIAHEKARRYHEKSERIPVPKTPARTLVAHFLIILKHLGSQTATSEGLTPSRVAGAGTDSDTSNLTIIPTPRPKMPPTPVEPHPKSTPDIDASDDEDFSIRRLPGLANYFAGWAISQEAVMQALKTTNVRDRRIMGNIHRFSRDYVDPDKWDVRLGAYIRDCDRENLEIEGETVIVADGADTPEGLEARLGEWKEFPGELWRIHKWMKGPHVFKNLG